VTSSGSAQQDRSRLEAIVAGNVQGVGFRWFVQRLASRLELDGWVANRPDGSVEVVAEGSRAALEELLTGLRRGPAAADVVDVGVAWGSATGGIGGFSIRSGYHSGD
jgi:acylphosphatase